MDFSDVYKQSDQLVFFSPDQTYLATVVGHKLILRDAETMQIVHVIAAMDTISYVEFSPDTKYLLCASYELGVIQVWTLDGHEPVANIDEGVAGCIKAMWHPNSRCVLSWSSARLRISIWNLVDAHLIYIPQPKNEGSGYTFRHDHRYLAILDWVDCKDTVSIYDCVDWELVKKFPIDTLDAKDLAWSPDGRFLAVWDTNLEYKIIIYTPEGHLVQAYSAYEHGLGIKQVQWSPTGQFLAVSSFDQKIRILNHYTFEPLVEWTHGPTCPSSVPVFRQTPTRPNKTSTGWPVVLTTRPKLQYELVTPPTNIIFPSIKVDPDKWTPRQDQGTLAWSPDGMYLAVKNETMPTLISVYSVPSLRLQVILQALEPVKSIHWHPTRHPLLVFCTGTETLHFWDGRAHDDAHHVAHAEAVVAADHDDDSEDDLGRGLAETIEVPAADFHISAFRWSTDGKKIILLDKKRFCIGFEVELP